ncbi:MAG TPA: glycosyltransferase [Bacteroidales bacterium]|nr:glycosyltransferase [Bacteroidales bacterium]
MSLTLTIVSLVIVSIYSILIIVFAIAFIMRKTVKEVNGNSEKFVSIIVAFRNEESNLASLIEGVFNQNFKGDFEIILVNDHSEDNFYNEISKFSDKRIYLFDLPDSLQGKKSAIRYAVSKAKGEILVFTDADCKVNESWLRIMISEMESGDYQMICGPVEFLKSQSVFSSLFQLEFLSLTGSGAAGFFINKAFMCNGANYAVYRESMIEALEHVNDKYSSGDDVFLLHYLSMKQKVGFVKYLEANVKTKAPQSLSDFISQRVRWASKTSGYRNSFAIFVAVITFLASLTVLVSSAVSIFNAHFLKIFAIIIITKFIAELVFMIPVCNFYKKQNLIFGLVPLSVFHPVYIVLTAFLSLFFKPKWKGRKIS